MHAWTLGLHGTYSVLQSEIWRVTWIFKWMGRQMGVNASKVLAGLQTNRGSLDVVVVTPCVLNTHARCRTISRSVAQALYFVWVYSPLRVLDIIVTGSL